MDDKEKELDELLRMAAGTLVDLRPYWKELGGDDGQGHYEGDYSVGDLVKRLEAARAERGK